MRTALILLILTGLASVPGSLLPQERVDPRAVSIWKASHSRLAPIFDRAGMFHVFGSAWFSAIYLLLMISLVGCLVPRLRVYWHGLRAQPPPAPQQFDRLPASASIDLEASPAEVGETAARLLRRQRFRVVVERSAPDGGVTVSGQRGYLREAGNLVFHFSLLLVLVAFSLGDLFGFRGGVIVLSGQTFTNAQQSYDNFAPGVLFSSGDLAPFTMRLDDFTASFIRSGPQLGQPTAFQATVSYRESPGSADKTATLRVNHPLTVRGTSVFLVGNGYAPVVTVRDGTGRIAYSGPAVFLPENATYASWGVIKVPDATPVQLGFEGEFLPTYGRDSQGTYSQFPDLLAPALSLTAYRGDLGLGSGVPQSVYALTKSKLTAVANRSGKPVTLTIPLGGTRRLPHGAGSIRFDGVQRWARLQISATPAEPLALAGVVLALLGLLGSLYVRPRRLWLRTRPGPDGATTVELGALDRHSRQGPHDAIKKLIADLKEATP